MELPTVLLSGITRQDRLALLWRQWLTWHLVDEYLSGHAYYRIKVRAEIDNPDQRMCEDVRTYTSTLLSFFLVLLNWPRSHCRYFRLCGLFSTYRLPDAQKWPYLSSQRR